jgi:hypothetical protein
MNLEGDRSFSGLIEAKIAVSFILLLSGDDG